MIDGKWRSANFDELLSFRYERQRVKTSRFSSVHQRETFDLVFVNKKATNDEIRVVAELKLLHGTVLGSEAD
jgi:hypothetical protein